MNIEMFIVSCTYDMYSADPRETIVKPFFDKQSAFSFAVQQALLFADEFNIPTNEHFWGENGKLTQFRNIDDIDTEYLFEDDDTNRLRIKIHPSHLSIHID